MIRSLTIFIVTLFVMLFSASCKKTTLINIPINPEILKYFDFKVGTYWIYRDSLNGNLDSFAVFLNYKSKNVSSDYSADNVSIGIKEFHNGILNDTIGWGMSIQANILSINYSNLDTNGGSSINFIEIPYPITFSSIIIDSINYYNVYEIYENNFNTIYINETAGFIKMKIHQQYDSSKITVWELKKYNINY